VLFDEVVVLVEVLLEVEELLLLEEVPLLELLEVVEVLLLLLDPAITIALLAADGKPVPIPLVAATVAVQLPAGTEWKV